MKKTQLVNPVLDEVRNFSLRYASPLAWVEVVMADFDAFLLDHASAEKKASGMAISLLSHYPDRKDLVAAMAELAVEELVHFREVIKLIQGRGLELLADAPDDYVNRFRRLMRKGSDVYMLDRLLIASIVEARGHERFGLIADALPEGNLKKFYLSITASEARHHILFVDLALKYFSLEEVASRLDELLDEEATIMASLPIKAALH
ncbi:tRNA-(ms(2)io(6)A)-hydroxylase [Oleiphilus messinensis]|uniref:tRNA-(Ms(2)io(6)A)-hydroxylase n=1 Tax=Oleiphilus messinensis TaxID=141451 RepID=A0A1Y0ICI0_9GAMM|nr:tRNA-(ms[2]io[6]A)-hydroxylase [Oleiphilus messinensis]ARU57486.1 tRNA-(ms(2)io(6)A)-hydroxylase [Oleiphilus messinensis]